MVSDGKPASSQIYLGMAGAAIATAQDFFREAFI
jgi:hypothetical protein